MLVSANQLFSHGSKSGKIGRIIQFPLTRIIVALLFFFPTIILYNILFSAKLNIVETPYASYYGDFSVLFLLFITILLYSIYVRFIEKRPVHEFGLIKSISETAIGFLISLGLVIITLLFILWKGKYVIKDIAPYEFIIHALFIFGFLAFIEELIFRGILFRLFEELIGSWYSFIVIALLFSTAHLLTGEATIYSIMAIAVMDLIQTGAYILTRRIWLTWGIHWGWNFMQDGILGMPNSGVEFLPSFINPEISGPVWLTGGETGIELSVIGIVLNLIAGIYLLYISVKRNQTLYPFWKRKG